MSAIGDFFKKIGHGIKTGALAFAHVGQIVQSIIDGLKTVAESQGGAVAREKAFNEIKAAAVNAGVDLKSSLINLLIELAVNRAKGTLAEIATASN